MRYGIREKNYTNRKPSTNPVHGRTFATKAEAQRFAEKHAASFKGVSAATRKFEIFEVN